MSILIKGMEMPKDCIKCPFCLFADGHWKCLVDGSHADFGGTCRPQSCPLIPVPPHGKLGDLDELYASLKKWLIQNRHSMTEATRVWIRGVLEGIAAAPTIILAEEVYGKYTDTVGKMHWTGTRSGEHIIPAEPCNNLSKPCNEEGE